MISLDFETKGFADLKQVGAWAYSEDSTTQIICLRYAIDNGPTQQWWPKPDNLLMPSDLHTAIIKGHHVECHHLSFEYSIWANIMVKRYGWLPILDTQWRDSMAVACYYGMPAALDKLAHALGYQGKDPEGARLITKYSKLYLKTAKQEIPPEDFQKFLDYCAKDVAIEQSVSDELGDLPERELEIFKLDLKINSRGLYLDREGIAAAEKIVEQRAVELKAEFEKITGLGVGQRDKIIAWFAGQGVVLENMQAEYLEELLDEGPALPKLARRALEIRLQINKASTSKLAAMARQCGKDGRARFQTRYHGAITGRNTGSGFQPLNLVRPWEKLSPEQLVRDIMYGDAAWLDCLYGSATEAVSKASRHWIMAAPGNKIMAADYVSIEAVVLACLAGEEWKVDAFRNGVGVYETMACKIYNMDPALAADKVAFKKKYPLERQDGKTGELAFGYQGALNAWLKFDSSGRHTDERIIEMCRAWRREHPMIVALWRGLEDASIECVATGRETSYRDIGFARVDEWLAMILPDGKHVWYRQPELRMAMPKWHDPMVDEDCAAGTCRCKPKPQLTYMTAKGGSWFRTSTYGGKLTENVTQATARQLLWPAAMAAEKAGYEVVLTVYDEVVAEVPEGFGSLKEFEEIMRVRPEWAKDWPINVEGWEGKRYTK